MLLWAKENTEFCLFLFLQVYRPHQTSPSSGFLSDVALQHGDCPLSKWRLTRRNEALQEMFPSGLVDAVAGFRTIIVYIPLPNRQAEMFLWNWSWKNTQERGPSGKQGTQRRKGKHSEEELFDFKLWFELI